MTILPQELEVWYVLPALRRELAVAMKKQGLKQKAISKKLGLTESAVSQYFKKKRANEVSFNSRIKQKITESAKKIIGDHCLIFELNKLCKLVKKEKLLCKIHKKHCKISGGCSACT
ncbi:helix-turn-helix domain-containing protein [Candidatus Woesearchaeota archaeon]|nr:helix-turn-helix domain-containing protein [Candidatus Woesearchaeota archaeon]